MNAWLLTWEGTGSRIVSDNKILAIISSRRSSSFIKDLVDVLYSRSVDSAYDMANKANKKKQRDRELRATFSTPSSLFYGRNPMIFARLVTELKVVRNEAQRTETVSWKDPPYLRTEMPGELPVVVEPERYCELVRQINVPLSGDIYYKQVSKKLIFKTAQEKP